MLNMHLTCPLDNWLFCCRALFLGLEMLETSNLWLIWSYNMGFFVNGPGLLPLWLSEAGRPPTSVPVQVLQLLPSGFLNPHWSPRHSLPCFPLQETRGRRKRNPGICLGPSPHTLRDAQGQTSDVLMLRGCLNIHVSLPERHERNLLYDPGMKLHFWCCDQLWCWTVAAHASSQTCFIYSRGAASSFFFLAVRWEIQYPVFKRIWLHWFHCPPLSR